MKPAEERLDFSIRGVHSTLRGTVKNLLPIDLIFLRYGVTKQRQLSFEVKLEKQPTSFRVQSKHELNFVLLSICCSKVLLGPESIRQNVERLLEIRSLVVKEIESVYSREEIAKSSTGGFPSLKHILLFLLVLKYKPVLAVETGVAQGTSSRFILEAMAENGSGKLISIDLPNYNPAGYEYGDKSGTHDPVYVKRDKGTGWLVPDTLRGGWTLLDGKSEDVLPRISSRVDAFFHDSEHSYQNMMFEYGWAVEHLSKGGLLFSDDIGWNKAFTDFTVSHKADFSVISNKHVGVAIKSR